VTVGLKPSSVVISSRASQKPEPTAAITERVRKFMTHLGCSRVIHAMGESAGLCRKKQESSSGVEHSGYAVTYEDDSAVLASVQARASEVE